MEDHWEHALFEGCIVMRNPKQDTVISDDELIQFSFPNSYQVPKNSYRFLYPELPDLNLFPTSFIAVFSTTNGTQFGHTIRTDDYTICIISYYCWETLFKSVLIEAVKCYDDGQVAFEKYLQEISDKEYPNIPINSIFSMRTSIIIEKLLLSQVIIMFNSILCERRIVIVCSNFETLSSFMLSTLQLLSPLTWPHPIVSILPQCYGDIIDLPTPFICGMATQQFLSCGSFSNKIVLVNLDDGTVRSNDSKMILDDAGLFPETIQTYLKDSLKVVQTSKPSEIPLLLQRTFNTYIQKLLQSPETFIMVKKVKGKVKAILDVEKYKKTYHYKVGNRKFVDFFVKTGAFDQYLQRIEAKTLTKKGLVVETPEPTFWDSLFRVHYPTSELTKKREEQMKIK